MQERSDKFSLDFLLGRGVGWLAAAAIFLAAGCASSRSEQGAGGRKLPPVAVMDFEAVDVSTADVVDVQTGKIEVSSDDQASSFDDVPAAADRLADRLLSNYIP
jgi:hypothetical protein